MPLSIGDPAPWFTAPTEGSEAFLFSSAAGRFVLLAFLPSDDAGRFEALKLLAAHQGLFDDARLSAFVVLNTHQAPSGLRDLRGLRWILDGDGAVARLYGARDLQGVERPHWLLLDPTLRVYGGAAIAQGQAMFAALARLPAPGEHAGAAVNAPVLTAPRIFEPELCRRLIELHEAQGGEFTGVMRDQGERTVAVMDELKKRRDIWIEDKLLRAELRAALELRLFPLIRQAFQFQVTEIDRYLVACYDAAEGGVFRPHRDNFTRGTAYRKFACSLNLNDDFEGGDLRFGEFGPATYRPPAGGAVVFSCALMHEALPVKSGRRYAFLPFFHDEDGAQTLEAYQRSLAPAGA